jgi:hypothetical protein
VLTLISREINVNAPWRTIAIKNPGMPGFFMLAAVYFSWRERARREGSGRDGSP